MIRQGIILFAVVATACATGWSTKTTHSKKNTFQAQSQYPSVVESLSAKAPAPQAAPAPYAFTYDSEGSSRQESADASGKVRGSYKVTNEDGSVRVVNYVADENGFRADVETNEPGTKSDNPADVHLKSAAPERIAEAPRRTKTMHSQKTAMHQQQPFHQSGMASKSQASTHNDHRQKNAMRQQQQPFHQSGMASKSQASTHNDHRQKTAMRQQQQTFHQSGMASKSHSSATQNGWKSPSQSIKTNQRQESHGYGQHQQSQITDSQPKPYSFSYDAQAEAGGSSRTESSDGSGKVVGSYTVMGPDGHKRIINYEADHEGFRAKVDTNEFGTKSESPASVQFMSSAPQEAPRVHPYVANGHRTAPAVQQSYGSSANQASTYKGQSSVQYGAPAEEQFQFQPFSFNYEAQMDDGSMSRTESADGSGKVVGSYSMYVADGRQRTVDYLADHEGFRATVNTNEFGTKAESPASVQFYSSATMDEPAPYSSPKAASSHSSSHVQQQPIQFSMENGGHSYSYQSVLEDGGTSAHSETSDGSGHVSGHYSMSSPQGSRRQVDYSAGREGFQAVVDTNEHGTSSNSPAHATFISSAPQAAPEAPRAYKAHQSAGVMSPEAQQQAVPYAFNYEAEASGGSSSRKESADSSGVVTGSYEVHNEDGSVRIVEYIADENGFRANVKTNEAGTKSDHPADVVFKSDAPAMAPVQQQKLKAQFPQESNAPVQQQKLKAQFPQRSHMREISQKSIDAFA